MKIIAETPRLLLREVNERDAAGFFEMDSDPEVARYTGSGPVERIEECLETIRFLQSQYATHGIGRWAVILKETGEFIGWCGLKRMAERTMNGYTGHVDIGYKLMKKHWGKGYATEAAQAALEFGLTKLGFTEVYALAYLANVPSQRVLEKIGLQRCNEFDYEEARFIWYALKSSGEFLAGSASR